MASTVFPVASSGMTTTRFPATNFTPFNIPAGLTLQSTVTTTTAFSAGSLPAQVWVVMMGGGGSGAGWGTSSPAGAGGGACIGWVDVPSAGLTATIGAGGAAQSSNTGSGNVGGNTTFGNFIAYGGGGASFGGLFSQKTLIPRGDGAGYGGCTNSNHETINTFHSGPKGSPFLDGINFASPPTSGTGFFGNLNNLAYINWNGGGRGGEGAGMMGGSLGSVGGAGLSGGGGGNGGDGGVSSRNAGLTTSFAGGVASGNYGGGGAGLLAAGGAGSSLLGGTGGSGGGGGGCSGTVSSTSGAGGNGCVLIYY